MIRLAALLIVLVMMFLMSACTMSQTTNGASAQNTPVQPTNSNNPVNSGNTEPAPTGGQTGQL